MYIQEMVGNLFAVYIYKENLGSESKVIHSFLDFFVIQNGKNRQNFHFEKER